MKYGDVRPSLEVVVVEYDDMMDDDEVALLATFRFVCNHATSKTKPLAPSNADTPNIVEPLSNALAQQVVWSRSDAGVAHSDGGYLTDGRAHLKRYAHAGRTWHMQEHIHLRKGIRTCQRGIWLRRLRSS